MRRRGFIYREGTHWTVRHLDWIRHMLDPGTFADEDQIVLSEYLALLEYKLQRRDELDRRIEDLALTPRYKPLVDRLRCFRGFKTQAAMVLATELGDVRRFESPRQLMAYVGLIPSEHSSGERRRLGAITKAGNTRVPPYPDPGCMALSEAPGRRRVPPPPSTRPGSRRHSARLEVSASPLHSLPSTRRQEAQAGGRHGRRPRDGRLPLGRPPRRGCLSASGGEPRRLIQPASEHWGVSGHDRRTPENVTGYGPAPNPRE